MILSQIHLTLAEGGTSFWTLVSNSIRASSAIENGILVLLLICSVASWAIVLWKIKAIRAAKVGNTRFGDVFESAEDTGHVAAEAPKLPHSPHLLIYSAAMDAVAAKPVSR